MNFLRLLADVMRGILEYPYRAMSSIKSWRRQRLQMEIAASDLRTESEAAKGVGGFFRRLGKVVLWILLLFLLASVFYLLYWLNDYLNLPRLLGGPVPALRPFWLPIVVILIVVTIFLAVRLWRLLGPERDANAFPELEAAWLDAEAALVQAGINTREAPLFFVVGKPLGAVDAVFSAAKTNWLVRQAPTRVDAPIQVYAHRQAIFVALGQQSLLGLTLERLAQSAPSEAPPAETPTSVFADQPQAAAGSEIVAAKSSPDMLATPNLLADEPAPRSALAAVDFGERVLTLEERTARTLQSRWEPLADDAIETAERRLNAMVRVVAKQRRPYCAANGVLLLTPANDLTNATDAGAVASAIETDLAVLAKAGQTRCPVWLLVTDLHVVPGFDALFESLDVERRQRLLGCEFPFRPDLGPDAVDAMASSALSSFVGSLSALTQRLFLLESAQMPTPQAIATNGKLFELIEHLEQRRAGLESIVRRIIHSQSKDGFYFGGFYVAATGTDAATNQAFVPGVLRLMLDHQNKVTWTDAAIEEEADYQRWATFGYAAMAVFCALLVVLGYWRWHGVG